MGKHWLDKPPRTIKDWLGIMLCCIAFWALLNGMNGILDALGTLWGLAAPFAWAAVLAYVLDTLVRPLHRWVLRDNPKLRWLAILAAYLLAGLAVFGLVRLALPQLVRSATTLFLNLPDYINNVQAGLVSLQGQTRFDLSPVIAALDDYEQLMAGLWEILRGYTPQLVSSLGSVASYTVQIVIAVAGSVFMLADKEHLLRQLRMLVWAFLPRRASAWLLDLARFTNETFASFFFGKIVASAVIGLLLCGAMSLLGIHFAPLISVMVAFANLIPFFGIYLGALPGVLILLFVSPVQALACAALVVLLQQFDLRVLAPRVLGHVSGLSAFWVLFAIVVGGWLYGPVGMVLGVPAFATLYSLARRFVYWVLARRGMEEETDGEEEEQTVGAAQ